MKLYRFYERAGEYWWREEKSEGRKLWSRMYSKKFGLKILNFNLSRWKAALLLSSASSHSYWGTNQLQRVCSIFSFYYNCCVFLIWFRVSANCSCCVFILKINFHTYSANCATGYLRKAQLWVSSFNISCISFSSSCLNDVHLCFPEELRLGQEPLLLRAFKSPLRCRSWYRAIWPRKTRGKIW